MVRRNKKIGIFDSGLGGLFTLRSLVKTLPFYEYAYLGDTLRLPYGNRSDSELYTALTEAVDFFFKKGCVLVLVACNTASAKALRKVQREYLPKKYPGMRVLGVIIPLVEKSNTRKVGIIGTKRTISSKAYEREFKKKYPTHTIEIFSVPTPTLVPLIESGELKKISLALETYLSKLPLKKIDTLILGCTHYPIIKKQIRRLLPRKVKIISQETIIPSKTRHYLRRHTEIEQVLSKRKQVHIYVTKLSPQFTKLARQWFGATVRLSKVTITQ